MLPGSKLQEATDGAGTPPFILPKKQYLMRLWRAHGHESLRPLTFILSPGGGEGRVRGDFRSNTGSQVRAKLKALLLPSTKSPGDLSSSFEYIARWRGPLAPFAMAPRRDMGGSDPVDRSRVNRPHWVGTAKTRP